MFKSLRLCKRTIPGAGCVIQPNFFQSLLCATLFCIACVLGAVALYIVKQRQEDPHAWKLLKRVVWLSKILLPPISLAISKAFRSTHNAVIHECRASPIPPRTPGRYMGLGHLPDGPMPLFACHCPRCKSYDDVTKKGINVLLVDHTITCEGDAYNAMLAYASLMALIFPVSPG